MDKKTQKLERFKDRKLHQKRVDALAEELVSKPDNDLFESARDLLFKINKRNATEIKFNMEKYEAILKEIDRRELYEHTSESLGDTQFKYYPDYGNKNFNQEILAKKEFYIHKSKKLGNPTPSERELLSKKMCDPLFDSVTGERVTDKSKIMFNLTNSQKFLKTFMSPNTPYKSLLIYHGTGVGKTCTSISIAEQYSEQLRRQGKKIIILLNQSIKENFIKNIFNIQKLKAGMPYYQCTGEDYLKYVPDYEKMSIEDVQKRILKVIKSKYEFYGYQKFANMINQLEEKIKQSFTEETYPAIFQKKIADMFSDTVFIIDEAHNIKEGESMKVLPPVLDKVVTLAKNMKLLLLSATPMFDNSTEIIWLMNLLLKNDNRPTLKINDFFDSDGAIIREKIPLFLKRTRGLVSYVRGENPYRFPSRLYPTGNNILDQSNLPQSTHDGTRIDVSDRIKELVLVGCKMTGLQREVYNKMIESTEAFGAFKQPGIMCSNIVFPLSNVKSPKKSNNDSFIASSSPSNRSNNGSSKKFDIGDFISDAGFENVAKRKKLAERVVYEIKDNIFVKEKLKEFSTKIHTLVENVKKSEGVVFIYSQFINSGVIPVALALENAGYSKYGGSLLEKEVRPNLGKYIIISGSKDLSKNAYKNYLKVENENQDGERVKIIIGSETASEGLDFRFIRSVHILEPWFHLNKLDQVIGRAIRNCSHISLPPEKRNVTVYFYTAILDNLRESLDISIYREAEKKARNMANIEYLLKTNAVDCSINKENNIFFTDKDGSRQCNYRKCEYKCEAVEKDELTEKELNFDTVNKNVLKDIINDVVKILKVGNNQDVPIFSKGNTFSLNQIIKYVNLDYLGTLLGIHQMIIGREPIVDSFGRKSVLKYKNGMYVVVPENKVNVKNTFGDIKVIPYKRTKKIQLTAEALNFISEAENEDVKPKTQKVKRIKSSQVSIKRRQLVNTEQTQKNILEKYSSVYSKILNDVKQNSSLQYLEEILTSNSSKYIHSELELKEIFTDNKFRWLDYLDPDRKKIICEVLIYKYSENKLTSYEKEIFESLYNIMYNKEVYYKDIGFKGKLSELWGYKLANSKKKIEYMKWTKEDKQFVEATREELQTITKSFNKLIKNKPPLPPYVIVGYIELKTPQQTMMFKIRDKRKEGKKGTQIKTGSVCNNDGMKKNTILGFIQHLLEDDTVYKDVDKRSLPSKDLLCIQFETYLRSFDKDKQRYFYNYEEVLEYKITQKK